MWELWIGVVFASMFGHDGRTQPPASRPSAVTIPDDLSYRKQLLKFIPVGTPLGQAADQLEAFGFQRAPSPTFFGLPSNPGPSGPRFTKRCQGGSVDCLIHVIVKNDSRVLTDIVVRTLFTPRDASHFQPDLTIP
jgi:hypothetical protein